MRKIAFASIEIVYDFDTEEEAKQFISYNANKKWWWVSKEPYPQGNGVWTVTVRKPYKDYNPGW